MSSLAHTPFTSSSFYLKLIRREETMKMKLKWMNSIYLKINIVNMCHLFKPKQDLNVYN